MIDAPSPPPKPKSKACKKIPAARKQSSPLKRQLPSSQSTTTNSEKGLRQISIDIPVQDVKPVLVGDDEVVVNEDNVSEMLDSTNWKLRKAAYDVLINLAVKKVEGRTPSNDISSSDIHSCIKVCFASHGAGQKSLCSRFSLAPRFFECESLRLGLRPRASYSSCFIHCYWFRPLCYKTIYCKIS